MLPWRKAVDHSTIVLVALFLIVRLLLALAGCVFDDGNLTTWWQIADVALLRHDLWNTLWYLHSQPPLFNLLIGLALKAGMPAFPWIMGILFALVTLGGILAFDRLARDLTGRPGIALAMAAWLCVSPATMLFSLKLYYDSLVPGLLCMGFWCLHRGLIRRSTAWLASGFALLAAVVLLRSMMHPLFYALVVILFAMLAPDQRRRIAVAATAPTIAIALVLAKNLVVFGFFGLTSWVPLNLTMVMIDGMNPQARAALVATGRTSPMMATWAFAPVDEYRPLAPPIARAGQPSLDNARKSTGGNNYNNILYLKIGPSRMRDVKVAIAERPQQIAYVLGKSFYYFHRPASDFKAMEGNRARIEPWQRFAKAVFLIEPAAWTRPGVGDYRHAPLAHIGYANLFGTLCFLAACVAHARRLWRIARGREQADVRDPVLGSMLLLGLVMFAASSLFDVSENNRAYYCFGPLMILGALWLLFGRERVTPPPAAAP